MVSCVRKPCVTQDAKYLGIVTEKFDGLHSTHPGGRSGRWISKELHLSSTQIILWDPLDFKMSLSYLTSIISPPSHPHILLLKLEVWDEYQCDTIHNCRELRSLGNYLTVYLRQSSNCYWWHWAWMPWAVQHHTPFWPQATCSTMTRSQAKCLVYTNIYACVYV